MGKFPNSWVIIAASIGTAALHAGPPSGAGSSKPDFAELRTIDGKTFQNVYVKRIEPSALVILHSEGVARVSLFDLPTRLQLKYDFDPIAAMKAEVKNAAEESERRRSQMRDQMTQVAALEKARAESDLIQLAKSDWIPVEADVVKVANGSVIIRPKRVSLVPTRILSTLGLPREGPPRRVLEPFTPEFIVLDEEIPSNSPGGVLEPGSRWKGYLNPLPDRIQRLPEGEANQLPVHQGVAQRP